MPITIDDGAYRVMVSLARHTHWLNAPANWWTDYGLVVFVILAAFGAWIARGDRTLMAKVLWVPVAMLGAFAISGLVKLAVAEARPCLTIRVGHTVAACPGATDYSFPSNHAVLAGAAAAALWAVHRWLGVIAALNAVLIAVSRVYVGVHYPHDVVAGLLLGIAVAWLGGRWWVRLLLALPWPSRAAARD